MSCKHLYTIVIVSMIFMFFSYSYQGCKTSQQESTWTPELIKKARSGDIFLPDFSFAGYYWGERDIPKDSGTIIYAENFGVISDDTIDDSEALQSAFDEAHYTEGPVIVQLPAGRVILSKILYIQRSDFVLKGLGNEGKNRTVLYFPKPLRELNTPEELNELQEYLLLNDKRQKEKDRGVNEPFSLYSWSGGFIWTNFPGERGKPYLPKYDVGAQKLAEILGGKRGEHRIHVRNSGKLKPGDLVRINWYNKEGENSSLINYLYDNQVVKVGIRHWESPDVALTKQEVTIVKIEGDTIYIKEPLLHDLRPEWYPDITKWNYIKGIGIEDICFEFLYQEYKYHHVEYGFNGIYFTNTAHSWARNLTFKNGDNGILTDLCANITFENISVFGRKYHYGVHFGDCYNMLASNLYLQAPIVHSLTFNTGSRCCIYTNCIVRRDPALDQHSGLNYQNLFDNIKIFIDDPAHNPLTMGGAKYWSPSHAAFSTFWNIQIEYEFPETDSDTIHITGVTDSPSARLVGIYANHPVRIDYPINTYKEGINMDKISIKSLYGYQLKKRINKE